MPGCPNRSASTLGMNGTSELSPSGRAGWVSQSMMPMAVRRLPIDDLNGAFARSYPGCGAAATSRYLHAGLRQGFDGVLAFGGDSTAGSGCAQLPSTRIDHSPEPAGFELRVDGKAAHVVDRRQGDSSPLTFDEHLLLGVTPRQLGGKEVDEVVGVKARRKVAA